MYKRSRSFKNFHTNINLKPRIVGTSLKAGQNRSFRSHLIPGVGSVGASRPYTALRSPNPTNKQVPASRCFTVTKSSHNPTNSRPEAARVTPPTHGAPPHAARGPSGGGTSWSRNTSGTSARRWRSRTASSLTYRWITIINLYLSPSQPLNLQTLDTLLSTLSPPSFLVVGDFNCRHTLWGILLLPHEAAL